MTPPSPAPASAAQAGQLAFLAALHRAVDDLGDLERRRGGAGTIDAARVLGQARADDAGHRAAREALVQPDRLAQPARCPRPSAPAPRCRGVTACARARTLRSRSPVMASEYSDIAISTRTTPRATSPISFHSPTSVKSMCVCLPRFGPLLLRLELERRHVRERNRKFAFAMYGRKRQVFTVDSTPSSSCGSAPFMSVTRSTVPAAVT